MNLLYSTRRVVRDLGRHLAGHLARQYAAPLVALIWLASAPALAASIPVDTTVDGISTNGDCSLREAIQAANSDIAVDACPAGSGDDVVVVPAGTYTLTQFGINEDGNQTGDFDIASNLVIQGAGRDLVTITSNGADRLFDIHSGTVTITGVTITGGLSPRGIDAVGSGTDGAPGGAVVNRASLTLADCRVDNNQSGRGGDATADPMGWGWGGEAGDGGAIWSTGTLIVRDCTLTNNETGRGGNGSFSSMGMGGGGYGGDGGAIYASGTVVLERVLIQDNQTGTWGDAEIVGNPGDGGGVFLQSGDITVTESLFTGNNVEFFGLAITVKAGTYTIRNSTFSGNTGDIGATLDLGGTGTISHSTIVANELRGLDASGASVVNSIIVGNGNGGATSDCSSGGYTSLGHNLVGAGTGCPVGVGIDDRTVPWSSILTDHLTPLADNGGPTATHALRQGSRAYESGTCTDAQGTTVTVDQRGLPRPVGMACDIGAHEQQSAFPDPAPLVEVIPEPAGSNCPEGGQQIISGLDQNFNGTLDVGEVTSSGFVCNGNDGFPALVEQVPIPLGDAQCPDGGVRIDSGLDHGGGAGTPGDGVLHPDEVDASWTICNPGDGLGALLDITIEPSGANCEFGGQRIATGLDDNRDGVLDADEVDDVAYLCDSQDGLSSLIVQSEIPVGDAECPHGGQRIDIGLDDNRDGVLDASEIDTTSALCQLASDGCSAHGQNPPMWWLLLLLCGAWRLRRRAHAATGQTVR